MSVLPSICAWTPRSSQLTQRADASFVVKKLGLIRATRESGGQAGEGHAYLKNWIWWIGMTMMIIGEIANFVA